MHALIYHIIPQCVIDGNEEGHYYGLQVIILFTMHADDYWLWFLILFRTTPYSNLIWRGKGGMLHLVCVKLIIAQN